ncbi:MAG: DUF356 domain-containing protein [Methanosarcinaceae archaeon]|nr:DUF356 domain-containing protein [Methanosarcinaceae archaeon]
MKSFALVRADDPDKVRIALNDLETYGHMKFAANPKSISTKYADQILVGVMGKELKNVCSAASVVLMETYPSVAIANLKKIHPPAHIIIISSRHEKYFEELMNTYDIFPDFDRNFSKTTKKKNEE